MKFALPGKSEEVSKATLNFSSRLPVVVVQLVSGGRGSISDKRNRSIDDFALRWSACSKSLITGFLQ